MDSCVYDQNFIRVIGYHVSIGAFDYPLRDTPDGWELIMFLKYLCKSPVFQGLCVSEGTLQERCVFQKSSARAL